jgi:hypothetical protein
MIADEVNINREAVRLIMTEEFGMRNICYGNDAASSLT